MRRASELTDAPTRRLKRPRQRAWSFAVALALAVTSACAAADAGPASDHGDPSQTVIPSPSPTATLEPTPTPEPVLSPPAGLEGTIAYVAGPEDPQIHLLDLATGVSRQLTDLKPEDAELTGQTTGLRPAITCMFGPFSLTWSPDGSLLAFSYGGCEGVVYTVEMDGTLHRIGDGGSPSWSPDGSRLVFAPNVPYAPCGAGCLDPSFGPWELMVADPFGSVPAVSLTSTPAGFTPGRPLFSPDGSLIALTGPSPDADHIDAWTSSAYVVNADGTNLRHVIEAGYAAEWAPDGRLIVYQGDIATTVLVDVVTAESEVLVAGIESIPILSPDGATMLVARSDPDTFERSTEVRSATTGELLATVPGDASTWAPDGAHFAALTAGGGTTTVRIHAASGSTRGGIVVEALAGGPAWQPSE